MIDRPVTIMDRALAELYEAGLVWTSSCMPDDFPYTGHVLVLHFRRNAGTIFLAIQSAPPEVMADLRHVTVHPCTPHWICATPGRFDETGVAVLDIISYGDEPFGLEFFFREE